MIIYDALSFKRIFQSQKFLRKLNAKKIYSENANTKYFFEHLALNKSTQKSDAFRRLIAFIENDTFAQGLARIAANMIVIICMKMCQFAGIAMLHLNVLFWEQTFVHQQK